MIHNNIVQGSLRVISSLRAHIQSFPIQRFLTALENVSLNVRLNEAYANHSVPCDILHSAMNMMAHI